MENIDKRQLIGISTVRACNRDEEMHTYIANVRSGVSSVLNNKDSTQEERTEALVYQEIMDEADALAGTTVDQNNYLHLIKKHGVGAD